MQNGEERPVPADETAKLPEEVTKHFFRTKVWRHLENNGLAMFPRPVYNRIPNFKGSTEAAAKLAELDVFKNANTVKVNPDKPQEPVRTLPCRIRQSRIDHPLVLPRCCRKRLRTFCLEQHKTLFVPVPRLQSGFLNRMVLPAGETRPGTIRKAVSRNGMETFGKPMNIEDLVSLDLVVMGSVAVSKEGYRIGKGKGYGDLEFGLMMHMKAIKPSTLVVTTVHDCQVFDTLPAELFGPHDVPVDIIVTPTQIIETQRMSQRPVGILWNLLSNRRLELMPVLGQLREIEMLAGRQCVIKEEDTDVEERVAQRTAQRIRRNRRRTRSNKSQSEGEGNTTEGEDSKSSKPRRKPRSVNYRNQKSDSKEGKKERQRRPKRPKPDIDFTLKISNISPTTRVRDLKRALSERGIKPQMMVWKGFRGFAYIHFLKPSPPKDGEGDTVQGPVMDEVIRKLSEMYVGGTADPEVAGDQVEDLKPRLLKVEQAPPKVPRAPRDASAHAPAEPASAPAPTSVPTPAPALVPEVH